MIRLSDVWIVAACLFLALIIFSPGCGTTTVSGAKTEAVGPTVIDSSPSYGEATVMERANGKTKWTIPAGSKITTGGTVRAENATIRSWAKVDLEKVGAAVADQGKQHTSAGAMKGFHASVPEGIWAYTIIGLGCLIFVAGVVVWYWLKMSGLGIALMIGGGVVAVAGYVGKDNPWVYAVAGVVALGAGIYFVVSWWMGQRAKKSLEVVTGVIEAAPAAVANPIKVAVADTSADLGVAAAVKAAVRRAKAGIVAVGGAKAPKVPPTKPTPPNGTADTEDTMT